VSALLASVFSALVPLCTSEKRAQGLQLVVMVAEQHWVITAVEAEQDRARLQQEELDALQQVVVWTAGKHVWGVRVRMISHGRMLQSTLAAYICLGWMAAFAHTTKTNSPNTDFMVLWVDVSLQGP